MTADDPDNRASRGSVARPAPPAYGVEITGTAAADPCACPGWRDGCSGLVPAPARGEVAVAIVSDARMRVINRDYLGHDYATDVLSFPADVDVRSAHGALGDS